MKPMMWRRQTTGNDVSVLFSIGSSVNESELKVEDWRCALHYLSNRFRLSVWLWLSARPHFCCKTELSVSAHQEVDLRAQEHLAS